MSSAGPWSRRTGRGRHRSGAHDDGSGGGSRGWGVENRGHFVGWACEACPRLACRLVPEKRRAARGFPQERPFHCQSANDAGLNRSITPLVGARSTGCDDPLIGRRRPRRETMRHWITSFRFVDGSPTMARDSALRKTGATPRLRLAPCVANGPQSLPPVGRGGSPCRAPSGIRE